MLIRVTDGWIFMQEGIITIMKSDCLYITSLTVLHLQGIDRKNTSGFRSCGPSLMVSIGYLTHNCSKIGYYWVLFLFSKLWNLLGEIHSASPGQPCLSFVSVHLIIWHDSEPEGKEDCKCRTSGLSWALHGCRNCFHRDWDAQHSYKCIGLWGFVYMAWSSTERRFPRCWAVHLTRA